MVNARTGRYDMPGFSLEMFGVGSCSCKAVEYLKKKWMFAVGKISNFPVDSQKALSQFCEGREDCFDT